MKFAYDKSKVTWVFDGKEYEYCIDGISRASLEKNYIFIRSLKYINNEIYSETFTYISLVGLLIASITSCIKEAYSKLIIIIDENNKKVDINIPYLQQMHASENYIYVIAGKNPDGKLLKYSLHGEKIKEYPAPIDCTFERFFRLIENDKKIEVICNSKEDENGHWQWCFVLNTETSEWKKMQSIDGH